MFDYQTAKLMHRHGDERYPMTARSPHDPAELDLERRWLKGGTIFRCTRCNEEVVVFEPGQDKPSTEPI
jgi:hypothetical protein